ncbi:MobF family relaxase [Nocardia sp. NPDC058499]|uniref:MobF family relaxase n=1 Tax=Nocardia sp. NPDC058499 TaxID=3346530 RepID=UPI003652A3FC
MGGNLHKLSAGDGYTYLTKQVAAMDSSELGAATLADYYSMKGEAPGRWIGAGLRGLGTVAAGDTVTESQMKALFGHGRHPNAEAMEAEMIAGAQELAAKYVATYRRRGLSARSAQAKARDRLAEEALKVSRLGTPFKVFNQASEFRQAIGAAFSHYNTSRGRKWNESVPEQERARIRTDVGERMFAAEFGREPLDDRELSGFIARNSRQTTQACAGYDFTVYPGDKSISALWALAPKPIAEVVLACHLDAAADAVRFLEQTAVYTRTGPNGVAQVDVTGVMATVFTHRDSRAGEPYLHSHIAISNKVQAVDGRWLALDGRTLHKFAVWASEHYNTRMETYLRQRLGLRFEERPHQDPNKRSTRAIVGIDQRLCEAWSSRRVDIEVRRAVLTRDFQEKYGREPSPREAYALADRASVDTRQCKHEPRSEAEQRAAWHDEAVRFLGSERAVSDMLHAAMNPGPGEDTAPVAAHELDAWIEAAADAVVERVSRDRSTWQANHIGAEVERTVRAAALDPALVADVAGRVLVAALHPTRSIALALPDVLDEPAALRRRDGASVYITTGTQSYTSEPIMAAEQRILAAAARRDGRRVGEVGVGVALLEHAANNPDTVLNDGQVALVRGFATSGARVDLALSPAGTGKTTAMAVFARAWENDGGTVIGLASTANAAAVLRDEIGTTCDTIDKLLSSLQLAEFGAATGTAVRIPDWVRAIDATTVVIIDEAALASTHQLDQVIDYTLSRGGSVRVVADDKQLAAISAGGIVRALADEYGAYTLEHVVRFRDADGNPRHDEGAASLALRDGDTAAIGYYIDNGRVHTGDEAGIADAAYSAWVQDIRAGLDAVMMAPTHEITRGLNERARTDRLATWGPTGPEAVLRDGTAVSAGDVIRTMRNSRRLAMSGTDWVRNGYRWRVEYVHDDGALTVRHVRTDLSITLPAWYSSEHVMLGYASTIMSSQGITSDTSHTVLSGNETRNDIYMALTRGARCNDVYFPTALSGDEHSVISDDAMNPVTAVDQFTRMLARDGSQKAATTMIRELAEPRTRLAPAVDAYVHAVGAAAESLLAPEALQRIDAGAEQLHAGLTDEPAWATLRGHLAVIALAGADAMEVLTAAYTRREVTTAGDVAAVLDWRLDASGDHSTGRGPLPWLTGIPDTLREHATFGPYLSARADLVRDLADRITAAAAEWEPGSAPVWARPLCSQDSRALLGEVAVWRAAAAVAEEDRRPTGGPRFAIREGRYQRRLDERVAALLGSPHRAAARWTPLAQRIEPRLLTDPYWPVLADQLTTAARDGIDIAELTETVAAQRPLPDELPAAALWWRLTRHLGSLEREQTGERPRPDWFPTLKQILGPELAEQLLDDAAWPALVAAIEDAEHRWLASDILRLAADTLHDRTDEDSLDPARLAAALATRIHTLLDAPTLDPEPDPHTWADEEPVPADQAPPDPADYPAADATSPGETSADAEPDADYLAAVTAEEPPAPWFAVADEPPPITAAAGPARSGTHVDWDLLGVDADPDPLPYPDLPPLQRVARLRTDLDAARRTAARLWSAHLAGQGERQREAAPMLAALRRRADAQTPYRVAAMDAHHAWVLADRAATTAREAHANQVRAAAAARTGGDELEAMGLELEASVLETEAALTAADATAAKDAADHAHQQWQDAAGAEGTLTPDYVDIVADTIDTADLDTVTAARTEVELLEAQLARAENAAAHAAAEDDDLDTDLTDDRPLSPAGGPVATLPRTAARRRTLIDRAHDVAERLRGHRLTMLTDAALATEIDTLREHLRRARRQPDTTLSPTAVADQVRDHQQRLHTQADAITTARTAHTTVETSAEALARAREELAALIERRDTTKVRGRARRELDAAISDLNSALPALLEQHRAAHEEAARAQTAAMDLGTVPQQWDIIVARATDQDGLETELGSAVEEDRQRNERSEQRRTDIDHYTHALDEALAEAQRRADLDDTTRELEEHIRHEEHHSRPASGDPHDIHDRTPQPGTEPGPADEPTDEPETDFLTVRPARRRDRRPSSTGRDSRQRRGPAL